MPFDLYEGKFWSRLAAEVSFKVLRFIKRLVPCSNGERDYELFIF